MAEKTTGLNERLDVLRRRRTQILATGGVLFGLSLAVVFLLPPKYRSTATILIEEQEVPPDLVRSTVSSFADQRIQTIKHQVMSRSNLLRIIQQYGLYEGVRRRGTTEELLERMVDDIRIEVISAEVVDRRTLHPIKATIAFTLAYDGESPPLAQKVANDLTSLFLAENLKNRERHAQETTAFLKREATDLASHIERLEKKIADFKHRADGALPELIQLNMQLMNQVDRELTDVDQRINAEEERKSFLEAQLATIKPNTPIITAAGERLLDSGERLKAVRAQYASAASYLSPEHPDIIKMKKEIEALEKETGSPPNAEELAKRLTDEQATMATLRERYGSDHPDVVRAGKIVSSLEKEIQKVSQLHAPSPTVKPENPAYIQIQAQLASSVSTLSALRTTRGELKSRTMLYAQRLEKTPAIEPEYLDLTRDRDNSSQKYQEIRSKLLEAQVSEGLEIQRKGERFSLIDPPDLPEKPEKPNRPALLFLGLVLSVAGGVGFGAAAENMDHSIRSADMLRELVQAPPLGVIPFIPSDEDHARMAQRKRTLLWIGAGMFALLLVSAHFLWLPLDVAWFTVLRKLGLG